MSFIRRIFGDPKPVFSIEAEAAHAMQAINDVIDRAVLRELRAMREEAKTEFGRRSIGQLIGRTARRMKQQEKTV